MQIFAAVCFCHVFRFAELTNIYKLIVEKLMHGMPVRNRTTMPIQLLGHNYTMQINMSKINTIEVAPENKNHFKSACIQMKNNKNHTLKVPKRRPQKCPVKCFSQVAGAHSCGKRNPATVGPESTGPVAGNHAQRCVLSQRDKVCKNKRRLGVEKTVEVQQCE